VRLPDRQLRRRLGGHRQRRHRAQRLQHFVVLGREPVNPAKLKTG
jgi:hypothetical protein